MFILSGLRKGLEFRVQGVNLRIQKFDSDVLAAFTHEKRIGNLLLAGTGQKPEPAFHELGWLTGRRRVCPECYWSAIVTQSRPFAFD